MYIHAYTRTRTRSQTHPHPLARTHPRGRALDDYLYPAAGVVRQAGERSGNINTAVRRVFGGAEIAGGSRLTRRGLKLGEAAARATWRARLSKTLMPNVNTPR